MRERAMPHAAGALTAAVILAPLALPGYVLSYDMAFVPRQYLVPELIAPVSAAPRAVPLDAFVSLANTVVPGWLLQRVILVAIIWAAVVGVGRLVESSLAVQIVAGVAYGWTPFLAERLLIGQWGLLISYAALPWLVRACRRARETQPRALPQLVLAAGLSALSPTGGLIAAVTALVLLAGIPWRRYGLIAGGLVLVNLPWLVAALATDSGGHSDPAGVTAFAARAENWGGALVSLLGTGGIWNSETTPASRGSSLVPMLTLLLLLAALYGYPMSLKVFPKRFTAVALAGLALAGLSTVHFGASLLEWLVRYLPGAGLLRDSQKFVMPYTLLLVVCVALGAQRLAGKLPREPGRVVLAGVLIVAVGTVPDLAFGGAGALRPVRYPAEWNAVAQIVGQEPGVLVSLPLSEYRSYSWNRDRTVIDPALRYFPVPVLFDDRLVVGGKEIQGENPRVREIREAIANGQVVSGPRWALLQGESDSIPPGALAGWELVYHRPGLSLFRDPKATVTATNPAPHLPLLIAEIVALAVLIIALSRSRHWCPRRWRRSR